MGRQSAVEKIVPFLFIMCMLLCCLSLLLSLFLCDNNARGNALNGRTLIKIAVIDQCPTLLVLAPCSCRP